METTKKIKRVNKDEPTGFDRFTGYPKAANAVLNIIFIIMSLLCVIPILLVVAISFSAEDSITEYGYRFIPKIFSLEGYTFLTSQSTMLLRALGVSLFVTIVGTVLGVMLTTLMGYVLSRPNYKLNGFLTMVVFIPMVFNGGLVSTYFVVSQLLGLKNTIWALILPLAVSSFNVIICRTFFKTTVPESLIESAKMDGASQLTIFSRIVLPISLPVLATIGLFLCFAYWNDWYQSMLYIDNTKLLSLAGSVKPDPDQYPDAGTECSNTGCICSRNACKDAEGSGSYVYRSYYRIAYRLRISGSSSSTSFPV